MIWHKNNSFDYHLDVCLTCTSKWTEPKFYRLPIEPRLILLCLFWCFLPSSSSSLPPSGKIPECLFICSVVLFIGSSMNKQQEDQHTHTHTRVRGSHAASAVEKKECKRAFAHIAWKTQGTVGDAAMKMRQYRSIRNGRIFIVYTILIRHCGLYVCVW